MFPRAAFLPPLSLALLRRVWLVLSVTSGSAGFAQTARSEAARAAEWTATLAADHHLAATWQMKDGLPSDRIRAVLQTRDGYVWIGTPEGLVRFDGVRFRVFDRAHSPGLENNFIHRLFEDSVGRLWLAHDNGEISFYEHGQFQALPLEAEWKGLPVIRIVEDRAGTLWLLNSRGLVRTVQRGRVGPILRLDERLRSVAIDRDGRIWACTANRLFEISEGAEIASPEAELQDLVLPAIFSARAGGIWVASQGALRRWHGGRWSDDRFASDLPADAIVTDGHEMASGSLLLSTRNKGLVILSRTGARLPFVGETALPARSVESLCEDREGNVWIGTGTHGLGLLRPKHVSMLGLPGNEHLPRILSLHPGRDGGLWIGSEGSGLYLLRGSSLRRIPTRNGALNYLVSALAEDEAGNLLLAQVGGVAQRLEAGRLEPFADISALTPVHALARSPEPGTFWVGGKSVALLQNGRAPRRLPVPEAQQPANVRCFAQTPDGTLWIGTRNDGLQRYTQGAVSRIGPEHGLPDSQVWALHAEPNGTVWVATYGGGLARVRDGRVSALPADAGLPNVICHILDDHAGNFWFSSNSGIVRASRADLERCADGLTAHVPTLILDHHEGLTSLDMVGGEHSAGCRTPDGRLWFATAKGVAMVDPAQVRLPEFDPLVRIEDVKIDGRAHELERKHNSDTAKRHVVEIPAGSRAIDIDYVGLSFAAPNRLQFRYRFEGRDREWTAAGGRRTAYFWNLPPGDYAFRVMARNGSKEWRNEATLELKVLPFFWQTTWFAVLGILFAATGVGGVVLGFAQRASRKRLALLERQRAVERDRTRIAHDLHDDIGAGLTQLTLLAHSAQREVAGTEKAANRLDEMRGAIQRMTESLDEIVWAVNPQNDSLDSLVTYLGKFMQDFLHRAGIGCKLDFPFDLASVEVPAETRHALYLAVREALHNVVRHSGATEVRASLRRENDGVLFQIEDNGRGFATSGETESSQNTPRLSHGLGLQSMSQRLRGIGGECTYGNRPSGGAFVSFCLRVDSSVSKAPSEAEGP